jgi:acetyltransferase-like isoleucine patch superfamily enzyme
MIHFEDGSITPAYVTKEVQIGIGTTMDPNIKIGMPEKPVERFIVGDHVRLFAGQIAPRNFITGDYVTIHEGVWAYGRKDIVIGHNAWFGARCTLDAEGGFRVGNGFGAGQDSHLWSHIRHGDVVQGSRFLSFSEFIAEDDVWFVGRCTSGPAHHESWSVALTESNVTKGMKENHVYGGNPAIDLTDRIGAPYEHLEVNEKEERFAQKVAAFPCKDLDGFDEILKTFNVETRTYQKMNSMLEIQFMRYLLPEAKFVPEDKPVIAW